MCHAPPSGREPCGFRRSWVWGAIGLLIWTQTIAYGGVGASTVLGPILHYLQARRLKMTEFMRDGRGTLLACLKLGIEDAEVRGHHFTTPYLAWRSGSPAAFAPTTPCTPTVAGLMPPPPAPVSSGVSARYSPYAQSNSKFKGKSKGLGARRARVVGQGDAKKRSRMASQLQRSMVKSSAPTTTTRRWAARRAVVAACTSAG